MPRKTFTALLPVTFPMDASAYWSCVAATLLAKVSVEGTGGETPSGNTQGKMETLRGRWKPRGRGQLGDAWGKKIMGKGGRVQTLQMGVPLEISLEIPFPEESGNLVLVDHQGLEMCRGEM